MFGYAAAAAAAPYGWWRSSEAHDRYLRDGRRSRKILDAATHVESFTSSEKCSSQLCVCVCVFSPFYHEKVLSGKSRGVISTRKTYHKANRCDGLL